MKIDTIKGSDYDRFMKSLTCYKIEGENKHDDVPDSFTILVEYIEDIGLRKTMNSQRLIGGGETDKLF